jgi:hypothetical protein
MDCKSIFFHIIKNEKVIQIILAFIISFLFQQNLNAQKVETTKESVNYTIENCVNEFDLSKAKKTNSGYQYWFADKKFTEDKQAEDEHR